MDFPTILEPFTTEAHDLGVFEQSNENYHASEGVSKSGLFTLWTKTPRHYREGVVEKKSHFSLGSAAHTAILEPGQFESSYFCGPADRRGKKWDEALLIGAENRMEVLTSGQYEDALRIRDAAHRNATLREFVADAICEKSAFAVDEETGKLVRTRPDAYSPSLRLLGDVKTSSKGLTPEALAKTVLEFGYNVQEALYTDVWQKASGLPVDGFLFFFIETKAPYSVVPIELDRGAYQEGFEIYRRALMRYAECMDRNEWPGYPEDIQRIDIPAWGYRLTKWPEPEPEGQDEDEEEGGE